MAQRGYYDYFADVPSGDNVGLVKQPEFTLNNGNRPRPVANAITDGTAVVTASMTSTDFRITYNIICVLRDNDGNEAEGSTAFTFTGNPNLVTITALVPLDGSFNIAKIKSVQFRDDVAYRKNLYIHNNSRINVAANYVLPTAVTPPTDVFCQPSSTGTPSSTARLFWAGMADGDFNPIRGYEVYRSTSETGSYTKISGDDLVTEPQYTVEAHSRRDGKYYYKIKTIGTVSGYDSQRSEAFASLTTEWSTPGVPQNVNLTETLAKPGDIVSLIWDPSASGINNPVRYYEVWRSDTGRQFELIQTTERVNVGLELPPDNTSWYIYKVRAIGTIDGENSEFSAETDPLNVTFGAPSTPTNLTVNGVSISYVDPGEKGTIVWMPSIDGRDNPLQGYRIYVDGTAVADVDINTLSYDLRASMKYDVAQNIYVRAVGQYSLSRPSNTVTLRTNAALLPPRSNAAISEFLFFDKMDELQFIRRDAISLHEIAEEYRVTGEFPFDKNKPIMTGMRIGWIEGDELKMFEIRQSETDVVRMTTTIDAEHAIMAELMDCIVQPNQFIDEPFDRIIDSLLPRSGAWKIGFVTAEIGNQTLDLTEYRNTWDTLMDIGSLWGIHIVPRMAYVYEDESMTSATIKRYIDLLERRGENRGVRLTLDLNVQQAGVIYDDRDLYTSLFGFGKEQDIEDPDTGETIKKRVDFSGVAWSIDDSRPVDKPFGSKHVDDTDENWRSWMRRYVTYRQGVIVFDDIDDPQELLQATWDALQTMNKPKITISMTALDLSTIGYAAQGIALGDDVVILLDDLGIEMRARVTQFDRDVLCPEASRPTIGDYRDDVTAKIAAKTADSGSVNSQSIIIDRTLTVQGAAADAKAVGDKIGKITFYPDSAMLPQASSECSFKQIITYASASQCFVVMMCVPVNYVSSGLDVWGWKVLYTIPTT